MCVCFRPEGRKGSCQPSCDHQKFPDTPGSLEGNTKVPQPLPLSPFSPPDRDRRVDSPEFSGRGSRPSRVQSPSAVILESNQGPSMSAGTPSRPRRGIASPVAIRRGEGAQRKRLRDPRCSPRGNPACQGTFGGRMKAGRILSALQGGRGDFP